MERRNTKQKELVREAVIKMHKHVTADEVYDYIKHTHSTIGKGTVYRNLGILSDEGLIRRIEIPNAPDRFDYTLKNHYHVRCIECGEVMDVDMDELIDLDKKIRNKSGMEFLSFDILFKGICQDCRLDGKEA